MEIIEFLENNGISCRRFDHPPVYTCEQADALLRGAPGAPSKNLFLRDDKGQAHVLLMTRNSKQVDLRLLGEVLGLKRLGFASADRLRRCLGVEPGAVTVLALINDPDGNVKLFVDEELWTEDYLHCHPLVNTATLVISRGDLEKFFALTGHQINLVKVPESSRA